MIFGSNLSPQDLAILTFVDLHTKSNFLQLYALICTDIDIKSSARNLCSKDNEESSYLLIPHCYQTCSYRTLGLKKMKICQGRARKAENYWTSRRKGGKDWWITFCSEFQPASPFAHILVLFFFFSASTSCNFSMLNSCNNACNNYRRMQLRYVQMQRKGTLQFSYCRVAICMR